MDELKRDLNSIPYHVTTELEKSYSLSRQDIRELGFLRSNPTKFIYQHSEKPNLYLLEVYGFNISKTNFADEWIEIYLHNGTDIKELYRSNTPNKEDIQKIIDEN